VVSDWLPDGITSSAKVAADLETDEAARDSVTASELAHDGGVAADGPPVEGMLKRIHSYGEIYNGANIAKTEQHSAWEADPPKPAYLDPKHSAYQRLTILPVDLSISGEITR
jgi:hypothetical protein